MNYFKKIYCKLCKKKIRLSSAYTLKMNTADGLHEIKICDECSKLLEIGKENVSSCMQMKS